MLNISTKVNIINQRFTIEYNFKTLDVELSTYSQLNKTQFYYYKAYKILLRIKDSQGRIKEVTLIYYRMANISPSITIGILGLKRPNFLLTIRRRRSNRSQIARYYGANTLLQTLVRGSAEPWRYIYRYVLSSTFFNSLA